jgi:hypothetical protein
VNLAWTKVWDVKVLIPNSAGYMQFAMESVDIENEWDQYGECGEYLASCLELGDNSAVNVEKGNSEGVNFYLVLSMQVVHIVEKDFTCQWGTEFKVRDVVVTRKYYKKSGVGESNYVFLRNSPTTFLHVAHVKAINFICFHLTIGCKVMILPILYLIFLWLVLCKM